MAEYDEIAPKQRRTGYEAFRLANLGQSGGTMIGGRKGSGGKMRFNRSVAGTRDPGRAEERLRQQYAGMSDADRAGWESRANDGDIRSGREMEAAADYEAKKTALLAPQKLGEPVEMMETPAAPAARPRSVESPAPSMARTALVPGGMVPYREGMAPQRPTTASGGRINGMPTAQALTAAKAGARLAAGGESMSGAPTRDESIVSGARERAAGIAAGTVKPRTASQIAGEAPAMSPMATRGQTDGTGMLTRPDFAGESAALRVASNTAKFKAELDAKASADRATAISTARKDGRIRPLPQRPEVPKPPTLSAYGEGKAGAALSLFGRQIPSPFEQASDTAKMARYATEASDFMDENARINKERYGIADPMDVAKTKLVSGRTRASSAKRAKKTAIAAR